MYLVFQPSYYCNKEKTQQQTLTQYTSPFPRLDFLQKHTAQDKIEYIPTRMPTIDSLLGKRCPREIVWTHYISAAAKYLCLCQELAEFNRKLTAQCNSVGAQARRATDQFQLSMKHYAYNTSMICLFSFKFSLTNERSQFTKLSKGLREAVRGQNAGVDLSGVLLTIELCEPSWSWEASWRTCGRDFLLSCEKFRAQGGKTTWAREHPWPQMQVTDPALSLPCFKTASHEKLSS